MSCALQCDGCKLVLDWPNGTRIPDIRPKSWEKEFLDGVCLYDLCDSCRAIPDVRERVRVERYYPALRKSKTRKVIKDLVASDLPADTIARVRALLADDKPADIEPQDSDAIASEAFADPELLADATIPTPIPPSPGYIQHLEAKPEAVDRPKTDDLRQCSLVHVTPAEAATALGISVWTIRRMVDRGQLAGVINTKGSSRRYMIPKRALEMARRQGLGKRRHAD